MGPTRKIEIEIAGDASGIVKASNVANGAIGQLGEGMGKLGKLAAIGGASTATSVVAAGTAIAAFSAHAAEKFASVGGEVLKLQRYMGGTSEEASKLRFAAQESGVDFELLAKSTGILSKHLAANDKVAESVGIQYRNLDGSMRPANDILLDLAAKFESMPNGIEKNALALQLFGRGGADMAKLLNKGRDGLAGLEGEASKFGQVLSGDATKSVQEHIKSQREWHAAWEGLQIQIGQYVLPVLTKFSTVLTSVALPALSAVGNFAKTVIAPAFDAVGGAVGRAIDQMVPIFEKVGLLGVAFKSAFSGEGVTSDGMVGVAERAGVGMRSAIDNIQPALESFRAGVSTVLTALGVFWKEHGDQVMAVLRNLAATVSSAFLAIQAIFQTFVAIITDLWARFGHTLLDKLRIAFNAIVEVVNGLLTMLSGIFDLIKAILTGKWGDAWDAIVKILHGAWETILGVVKYELNLISAMFEAFKAAISAVWSLLWNSLKTVLSDIWAPIGRFVSGAFDSIVSTVSGMPSKIRSAAAGMWDGIKEAFRSVINWVIRAWNGLEFKVPGVKVFGKEIGGFTIGVPDIPLLASGGIVTAPTLAMIGEGSEPEAVVPLSQLGAMLGGTDSSTDGMASVRLQASQIVALAAFTFGSILLLTDDLDRHLPEKVAETWQKITTAIDGALKALDQSASDAASSIEQAASQIQAALQQMQQQQQSPSSSTSGSSSSSSTLLQTPDGGYVTPEFAALFPTLPTATQDYLKAIAGAQTYDVGGILRPGYTLALNASGENEHVLTDGQFSDLADSDRGGDRGGVTVEGGINIDLHVTGDAPADLGEQIAEQIHLALGDLVDEVATR